MFIQLTEFGCVDASFEGGQRDFRQVDALFSERYRQEFVGGVVFEYNTESLNSLAPYPFNEYGEGNFGLGYFEPESCDDIDTPCRFTPFSQFNVLSAKYAAVDTSTESLVSDTPDERPFRACPAQFPFLGSFAWPSSSLPDRECPGKVYVTCPGVPNECTGLGVPFQVEPPMTLAPFPPTTLSPQSSADMREATKAPNSTASPIVSAPMVTPTVAPTISQISGLPTTDPRFSPIVPTQVVPSATRDPVNRESPYPIINSNDGQAHEAGRSEESSVILCSIPLALILILSLLQAMG